MRHGQEHKVNANAGKIVTLLITAAISNLILEIKNPENNGKLITSTVTANLSFLTARYYVYLVMKKQEVTGGKVRTNEEAFNMPPHFL